MIDRSQSWSREPGAGPALVHLLPGSHGRLGACGVDIANLPDAVERRDLDAHR
jgi:hypothetical protein